MFFRKKEDYAVGQRWRFRQGGPDDSLIIAKIDGDTFHVCVEGATPIGHTPFSRKSLTSSLTTMVSDQADIPASFESGFTTWKSERGGVFDLQVSEAISGTVQILAAAAGDGFDDLVLEMRATRSPESMQTLFQRLFELPKWYFLGLPDNPRQPVIWVFPEGMNSEPSLLAFTSVERARRGAAEIGMPEASILPAPVAEARAWITGPLTDNEGLTWACFNFGSQNFPLYFKMLS